MTSTLPGPPMGLPELFVNWKVNSACSPGQRMFVGAVDLRYWQEYGRLAFSANPMVSLNPCALRPRWAPADTSTNSKAMAAAKVATFKEDPTI